MVYFKFVLLKYRNDIKSIDNDIHSFVKSWFFGMQQLSFNPAPFKNNNK